MKKALVLGSGTVGAGAIALSLLGAGIATADDGVVGATYKDARAKLAQSGTTAIVATTVGDRVDWDRCIVTSASPASFRDGYGDDQGRQMLLNLNCYAKYATKVWPGFSKQSVQGQEIYQADLEKKQAREAAARAAAEQAELEQLEAANAQQAGE